MTSETRGVTSSQSRDMHSNIGGVPSLHGSVTVSIIHNIDAAGLYNEVRELHFVRHSVYRRRTLGNKYYFAVANWSRLASYERQEGFPDKWSP